MDYAKTIIVGRLVRDVELKMGVGAKNTSVANGSIAWSDTKDHTSFIDFTMFGKLAENLTQYMKKGTRILLESSLKQDRWENERGKGNKHALIASNVLLLSSKSANSTEQTPQDTKEEPKEKIEKVPF